MQPPGTGAANASSDQVYLNNRQQAVVCSCVAGNLCNLLLRLPVTPLPLLACTTAAAAHDLAPKQYTIHDL